MRCAKCGSENPSSKKFCGDCGAPLSTPPELSQSPAGERRHLTVLFCHLAGSTRIAAQLDPEDWRDTVASYHDPDKCPLAQTYQHGGFDRVEQLARLLGRERRSACQPPLHRVLQRQHPQPQLFAAFHHVLGRAHGTRRVGLQNPAAQTVETPPSFTRPCLGGDPQSVQRTTDRRRPTRPDRISPSCRATATASTPKAS